MRLTIFIILAFVPMFTFGQQLIDREAYVKFFSSAPLEDIEAENKKALGALDLSNGNIAVTMKMTSFEFDKSLMKEHFNENYVESEKYPNAVFKGRIEGFSNGMVTNIKDQLKINVKGSLEIHGITREVVLPVTLSKKEGTLLADAVFMIRLEDYKIDIPQVVFMNIAEEVEVTTKFKFNL